MHANCTPYDQRSDSSNSLTTKSMDCQPIPHGYYTSEKQSVNRSTTRDAKAQNTIGSHSVGSCSIGQYGHLNRGLFARGNRWILSREST